MWIMDSHLAPQSHMQSLLHDMGGERAPSLRTKGISLTLSMCRDVERYDRNVHDPDVRRPVHLDPAGHAAGEACKGARVISNTHL